MCSGCEGEESLGKMSLPPSTGLARLKPMCRGAEDMDEALWQGLPEDVLDRVLAWLPFASVLRARGVCKRWKALVFSRPFHDLCAALPAREKYFLLFPNMGEHVSCSAFDTASQQWRGIPSLGFLPPQVKYVEGGAGGLLFFSVNDDPVALYVCNPITRRWRELPPMTHRRTPLVRHMVADRGADRYRIIVAGNAELSNFAQGDNRFLGTEVYDSRTHTWVVTGNLPLKVDLNWSSAYSNGVLYCVAGRVDRSSLGVATYHVEGGVWSDRVDELPEGFALAQVVECGGRVMAVAENYKNDTVKSIHVLELDLESRRWRELARMPRALLVEFRRICDDESFNCVVQDEKILLTSFRGMRVLAFDIRGRVWDWLPLCPFFSRVDSRAVGFSFEPSLHASP